MPKKNNKAKKRNISYDIYSEAFPPNKDGSRSKISSHSHIHDLLKGQDDTLKKIDPTKIVYKPLTISNISEVKNLHKEWFPIDYDDNYFKKIFINKHSSYFTVGAFYNFEIKQENNITKKEEIIIGMALCEFREVSKYFVNHTSREAVKEICDNIDFNEEVHSYLNCQSYNCVYIMTIGVLDEFRKLHIGSNLIKYIIDTAMSEYLCVGVYLDVIVYNQSAINFYEKNGFKKVSNIKNYYDIKGVPYDSDVFLKIFTRKEKDEFRRKNYALWKRLLYNFFLTPMNVIYKIIIFIVFCQCFRNKIKID